MMYSVDYMLWRCYRKSKQVISFMGTGKNCCQCRNSSILRFVKLNSFITTLSHFCATNQGKICCNWMVVPLRANKNIFHFPLFDSKPKPNSSSWKRKFRLEMFVFLIWNFRYQTYRSIKKSGGVLGYSHRYCFSSSKSGNAWYQV